MGARWLRRLATVMLTAIVLLPAMPASAERIASRGDDAGASRSAGLVRVHETLSSAEVARALAAQGLSADEVEQRLVTLKRLRDRGLITEEEYQQKRREILAQL